MLLASEKCIIVMSTEGSELDREPNEDCVDRKSMGEDVY